MKAFFILPVLPVFIRPTVFVVVFLFGAIAALASAPEVANVRVQQQTDTKDVDIRYDLSYDGPQNSTTVWVHVSGDGGRSYTVPAKTFSGDIGSGVFPGADRHIVWHMGEDFDGVLLENAQVRVTAHAGDVPIPPEGMEYIPGGHFMMGVGEEWSDEGGTEVYVSPFFMDRYEVTGQLWGTVYAWAVENGYSFSNGGSWRNDDHPVQIISWYDAVKWLNARSEMNGLTPVYYTDENHSSVYRTGQVDLTNGMVLWEANGYRLPTEAEWEKAARGGLHGKTYPWGDTIDGGMANYLDSNHPWSSESPETTPVGYYNGSQTPSGPDMENGYGLYDMAGNAFEWCWNWYTSPPLMDTYDPKGPDSASSRVLRGGSWYNNSSWLRVSARYRHSPGNAAYHRGFRGARGH